MATRTSSSTRARGGTSSRPANRRPQTRSAPRKGAKKPQGGGLPLPLRANVNNLLDRKYYASVGFQNGYLYGEPRSVQVHLTYRTK